MNLIFLGPPGAGKGTMAVRVAKTQDIPHISTGDLFRAAIKNETELGREVKKIIDAGGLVPDSLTVAMVKERLSEKDTKNGFILDGFPRTIGQAKSLQEFTTIDKAINFAPTDEEVLERLSGRRVCRQCGATYHIKYIPSKEEGKCDKCGGELYVRKDDEPEAIKNRLAVYKEQTAPLIRFYEKEGILHNIDASVPPDEVFKSLESVLS